MTGLATLAIVLAGSVAWVQWRVAAHRQRLDEDWGPWGHTETDHGWRAQ